MFFRRSIRALNWAMKYAVVSFSSWHRGQTESWHRPIMWRCRLRSAIFALVLLLFCYSVINWRSQLVIQQHFCSNRHIGTDCQLTSQKSKLAAFKNCLDTWNEWGTESWNSWAQHLQVASNKSCRISSHCVTLLYFLIFCTLHLMQLMQELVIFFLMAVRIKIIRVLKITFNLFVKYLCCLFMSC